MTDRTKEIIHLAELDISSASAYIEALRKLIWTMESNDANPERAGCTARDVQVAARAVVRSALNRI